MNRHRFRLAGVLLASASLAVALGAGPALASPQQHLASHDGGTLKLTYQGAPGSMDPQINYTLQGWQIEQATQDGLVNFKKAQGTAAYTVVPDLAVAIPKATNGGKTWVFKLRSGIKFSNGQVVKPSDVLATFQRIFKVHGPTAASFYGSIIGADKCMKVAATCTLKGGVIANNAKGTVTFNLTKPDGEWLQQIAVPLASIVPASTPPKDQGDKPVPGTGAYTIKSYDPNHQIVLVRNKYFKQWSADAQPAGYPDEITQRFDLTGEASVTQVENGQADWIGFSIPSDRLNEIGTKYPKQIFLNQLTAMWYVPMNTHLAPFNNLKARQAVNYAIDRSAVVRLFGGQNLGTPSCQILPAGFPGHVDYCPYTKSPGAKWSAPDLAKAKALVKASGTAGQKVALVVQNDAARQGDRYLPAEPAEPARLEDVAQGAGGEHPVHVHPEHQEPRADQPLAVVPGLPGGLGLPERAVRVRVLPARQRHEHQHLRVLQQADPGADGQGRGARRDECDSGQRPLGEDRQAGHRPVRRRPCCSRRRTPTSSRSGSATSSSAPSTTS